MPVVYAGIDLTPPAHALAAVERWWHAHRVRDFAHPNFHAGALDHLPLPAAPEVEAPRVGVLHWPTGASRWAVCHLLATGDQLARLERVATAAPDLVLSDGTRTITAPMYRVAARPVEQRTAARDLHLLTLVDDRYYWWFAGDQLPPSTASWSALLTALFAAVGVTPTLPTVHADYDTPDSSPHRWKLTAQPAPLMLDAAAKYCGLKVLRSLAGAVRCVDAATATASEETLWTAHGSERMAGGRAAITEAARSAPASVAVNFAGPPAGAITRTPTEYGAVTGVAGKVGAVAAGMAGSNTADGAAAYATVAARDYYRWHLSRVDATLRGLRNWTPGGMEDAVEWVMGTEDVLTRVLRQRASDLNTYTPEGCSGMEWLAGLRPDDCLAITYLGTVFTLTSEDGELWSGDPIEICGVEYTPYFRRSTERLTLVGPALSGGGDPVEFEGKLGCNGCSYAVFGFGRHLLCPCSDPLTDACDNVVRLRVEAASCGVACAACPGGLMPRRICAELLLTSAPYTAGSRFVYAWSGTDWDRELPDTDLPANIVCGTGPPSLQINGTGLFNVASAVLTAADCEAVAAGQMDVTLSDATPTAVWRLRPWTVGCSDPNRIPGFRGAGWYVIAGGVAAYLTAADGCLPKYVILCGPYDTEAEAEEAALSELCGGGGAVAPCGAGLLLPGWAGPGWYCLRNVASLDPCTALYLSNADRCDTTIELCSGPYASEAAAAAGCASGGGGGSGYGDDYTCPPAGFTTDGFYCSHFYGTTENDQLNYQTAADCGHAITSGPHDPASSAPCFGSPGGGGGPATGSDGYDVSGSILGRYGPRRWQSGIYALTAETGTSAWLLRGLGGFWRATGWDGTGAKVFALFSGAGAATITVTAV